MRRLIARSAIALTAATLGVLAAPVVTSVTAQPTTGCGTAIGSRQNVWRNGTVSSASDVDWFRFTTRAADRGAQLTLGALSANLSLALFDGGCHRIARSDHPGKRFVELTRLRRRRQAHPRR